MNGLVRATEVVSTIAAVSTGLVAGVYAAFSFIVMPALRSGPPAEALTVMQRINVYAVHPGFMVIFWTSDAASTGALVMTWLPGGSRSWVTTTAAALAVIGFLITVAFNVPRNNALALLDAGSLDDVQTSGVLLGQWVIGNNARAAAATVALAAYLLK